MNVENRKLFANRDARKRLAEMGGILASSPELMGEAMKFANGGTARERAISGQGALDQFASSGMQPLDFSLQDLDRDLGSKMQALDDRVQGRIVSFLGSLFEVVGNRIFHTESGVEIEEPNLKAEILTQGDRIAGEDMAMAQDVPQGQPRVFAQPEVMLPEAEPEVMFPGELSKAFVPKTPSEDIISMGPMEMERLSKQPILQQELAKAVLSQQPEVPSAKDLMAGPIYPAEERSSDTSTKTRQRRRQDQPNRTGNIETLLTTPGALVVQNDEDDVLTRAQEMADAEREQMTGMPDLAAPENVDVDVLLDAVKKNDPKAASAALMKSIAGVDVHGGTTPPLVEGDGKSPPSDDTPDAPKTRKQRMLESVDLISEMFGIREKDKAEDMYDLMATIGFAMASGESPNAMKNIADAFLVGAQMKRADKKEDKKLDQAIRTLAVKDVLEQESDERALAQLLKQEIRQDSRALTLFAEKLRLKEEMDPTSPAGRYLSSELGDAILGVYADVLKDETINLDAKGAEFFKRVGDKNATQFLGLTGFSAMGGGVGSGDIGVDKKSTVEQKYKIKP